MVPPPSLNLFDTGVIGDDFFLIVRASLPFVYVNLWNIELIILSFFCFI